MKPRTIVAVSLGTFCVLGFQMCFPPRAEAYLDPGTGSYLLQILVAGLLSGLFLLKPLVTRIKRLWTTLRGRAKDHNAEDTL